MNRLGLLAGAAVGVMGCAEPLHLRERGPGPSPYSFWPPPPCSVLWVPPAASSTGPEPLGAVASRFNAALNGGGYAETRWFPIGSDYQHGFAVTTRLERLDRDSASTSTSTSTSTSERWSALYPEPSSLRWLTFAQTPALPRPGHYRSFLIAFTDLPIPGGAAAPIWNEETLIDGPGAPERRKLAQDALARHITSSYRFSVFEYRYDWDPQQRRGRLRIAGDQRPANAWPPVLGSFQAP
jgi:hypothetical protein